MRPSMQALRPDLRRRSLLQLACAAALPGPWRVRPARAAPAGGQSGDDPFPLGVASGPGDRPGSIVLWTRVAPGLPAELARFAGRTLDDYLALRRTLPPPGPALTLRWELARDAGFRQIDRRGSVVALPELAHTVHLELHDLQPGRPHFYRFLLDDAASPVGRTQVFPGPGDPLARLRFGLASCQHYEYGFFGAYAHLAADDPDVVCFVGDYIYEGGPRPKRVRPHPYPGTRTLFDYRLRHALYRGDPDLQRLHAQAPWLLTWDDHEVSNDYANDIGEDPKVDGRARRLAAYQAYYEHLPLPASVLVERFAQMRMHRRVDFGRLARALVLDDRQHRDRQACPSDGRGGSSTVTDVGCPARRDSTRTLLGAQQREWLAGELAEAGAGAAQAPQWTLLVQQTLFSPLGRPDRDGTVQWWTDGWDGYPAERARVLAALRAGRTANPVFLGGDLHSTWVCDVREGDDARGPVLATEFTGTSITSANGMSERRAAELAAANPHVRFADVTRRGYLLGELTPRSLTMTLCAMDDVSRRAPEVTRVATWTVDAGRPGIRR